MTVITATTTTTATAAAAVVAAMTMTVADDDGVRLWKRKVVGVGPAWLLSIINEVGYPKATCYGNQYE
jgi:hypothetical protein